MRRDNRFELRLSDRELEMLREIAESIGVSQADVLRNALRMIHASIRPTPPPKKG